MARRQVRELGYSKSATYQMWHRSPLWEALTDQFARRVGSPRTDGQRLMAAVLDQGGDAVLSFACGMRWWGHQGNSLRPIVLATTSSSRRTTALAEVHRPVYIADHWTTELDGIAIVRPEMLSLQLFDVCRHARGERLVEWLWAQRLLSGPSIHQFLVELGDRGG